MYSVTASIRAKALILETRHAVDVSVEVEPHELASTFSITVTLNPDSTLESVISIVDAELEHFFRLGPGEEELQRARAKFNAGLIRGAENVGGFSGKAALLASGEIYDGRPDFYRTLASWINDAEAEEVRDAAQRWLSGGRYRLDVLPEPDLAASAPQVDRSEGLPPVGELPGVRFPTVERARLRNGIEVVLAKRDAVPLINVTVQFDAGYAADAGGLPGTSAFTLAMLEESTASHSALEIEAEAEALGAEIYTSATLDTSAISLSALKQNLAESIALLADVTRNPAFAADEVEQLRTRWLARIRSEQADPMSLALRTLPPLIYGADHAYGIPFTGSGTEAAIAGLERSDLEAFYRKWLRPDNATLFVVGDTEAEEIVPLLDEHFGNWRAPRRKMPQKNFKEVPLPDASQVFLADRPGSAQSLILAAHLAPPTGSEDNLLLVTMNDILGGSYNARVNQKIRVEKGWAYGAYTWLSDAQGQRPWMIYAPVQTDRTADAMGELVRMIRAYQGPEPATAAELQRSVKSNTNSLPGQYETAAAVMGALLDNHRFGRPDDYVATLKTRYRQLSLEAVRNAAATALYPDKLTWVVVGDLDAVTPQTEAIAEQIGVDEIHRLDIGGE